MVVHNRIEAMSLVWRIPIESMKGVKEARCLPSMDAAESWGNEQRNSPQKCAIVFSDWPSEDCIGIEMEHESVARSV
jgi:hypothetical protein